MGMYDEVVFRCPDCGDTLIVQSKAGECNLRSYNNRKVPADIAKSIRGEEVFCDECSRSFCVVKIPKEKTVHLELVKS